MVNMFNNLGFSPTKEYHDDFYGKCRKLFKYLEVACPSTGVEPFDWSGLKG